MIPKFVASLGMVQLADTVLFQSTVDRIAQTSTETYRIDDD